MVAAGTVLQVNLRGTFMQQKIQNVFHFRLVAAADDGYMSAFANGFWQHIKVQWRAVTPLSAKLIYTDVTVEALGGSNPFGQYTIPVAEQQGTRATATLFMPPFNAANITFNVSNRNVRPGSKRIAGLVEEDQADGVLNDSLIGLYNTLAVKLIDDVTVADPAMSGIFVIYGRENNNRPTPVSEPVVGYKTSPNVSSQNSRKFGRGN